MLRGVVSVGRGANADFRLNDPTVSKVHVEVESDRDQLWLTNRSERGASFVDGHRLALGERCKLEVAETWVQLGRVLLRVYREPPTVPVDEPMALPTNPGAGVREPLITIKRSGGVCQVWCKGHRAQLFPSAARVLARMAEEPGEVLSMSQLSQAASPEDYDSFGGTNVAQLVTYVRNMFDEALDEGWFSEEELRLAVRGASLGAVELGEDRRDLLRAMVENIRGVGYRLWLPLDGIAFLD
jgi:hypothetical protein